MSQLSKKDLEKGVICASAGNHAQGVALAASKLKTQSLTVMPRSTPPNKVYYSLFDDLFLIILLRSRANLVKLYDLESLKFMPSI